MHAGHSASIVPLAWVTMLKLFFSSPWNPSKGIELVKPEKLQYQLYGLFAMYSTIGLRACPVVVRLVLQPNNVGRIVSSNVRRHRRREREAQAGFLRDEGRVVYVGAIVLNIRYAIADIIPCDNEVCFPFWLDQ